MLKALILVHLWSLIVAGGAWILERDGKGRVGEHFPKPGIWLGLVALCFVPGILHFLPIGTFIKLPEIEIFEQISSEVSGASVEFPEPLNYSAIYFFISFLFAVRTLRGWTCLQRLELEKTVEQGVFTTNSNVPPLTLSWPRRAIVVPNDLLDTPALVRHEQAHLRYHDAELTLLLLLLKDLTLRNPGIGFLVRQWRLAIELRADQAAIQNLTVPERKDYAAMLLNAQRPTGRDTGTLPCPTARLSSPHHRNAKMRLIRIIEGRELGEKKGRWRAALILVTTGASTLGIASAMATVGANVIDMSTRPIDYLRTTRMQLPVNCPGLESDLKARGLKFEEKEINQDGQLVSKHVIKLGTVLLAHDVHKDGRIHNTQILDSSHSCFELEAKAGVAQWLAEPQEFEAKNVVVRVNFAIWAETRKELNDKLMDYLR